MDCNWLRASCVIWRLRLDCQELTQESPPAPGLMIRITFDIDDGVLARLHRDPGEFTRELRIAAAVKWYEDELVSQGRAAEIAGVSRAEFVEALGRYGITPFQDTLDELMHATRATADG